MGDLLLKHINLTEDVQNGFLLILGLRMYFPCDPVLEFLLEDGLEDYPNRRLDKEQLREKGKGEIEAHEFQPVGKQGENVEIHVIGVVEKRCDQAHGRTHNADGGADNSSLKHHGVILGRIEYASG